MDTTATLTNNLHQALTTAGLTPASADTITALLPPAGLNSLLTAARNNTLGHLVIDWIGDTADMLRLPHHEAGIVRSELVAVTR